MKTFFLTICILISIAGSAQKYNYLDPDIDVQHYHFDVSINDESNEIEATVLIRFIALKDLNQVQFDLVEKKPNGKGMSVSSVTINDTSSGFVHRDNRLLISLGSGIKPQQELKAEIKYRGVPADGLIISTNKYNKRTFFSDNWPNRAHNWLATVDHPSDKASVDWTITAPAKYQVISNGIQVEESNLPGNKKRTRYSEKIPLPTKVMVVGLAEFSVQRIGEVNCIPVSSWVYMEERDKGTVDYEAALEILPFFIRHLGPYAYGKLANVQSKTVFGGMENASAIFYYENSVTGKANKEGLIAHEIAHQYFGNMATEIHWSHLWLSEGFATYYSNLYLQSRYGADTLISIMKEDRNKVVQYYRKRQTPVVDTTVVNYMDMLNANSYDKASWVLHMLRADMGDSVFMRTVRTYYQQFAGKNAATEDFRKIAEKETGKNYQTFFNQWLFTAGHPDLDITWKYQNDKKQMEIELIQKQPSPFQFPLDLLITDFNGNKTIKTLQIKQIKERFTLPLPSRPKSLEPDPETKLLFEGKLKAI